MKNLLIALFLGLAFTMSAQSNFKIGGGVTYALDGELFGLQAKTKATISEKIDGEAVLSYFFGKLKTFTLDVNAQYKLLTINELVTISPLAGINYTNLKIGTKRNADIGLNLGTEVNFPVKEFETYLQAKYTIDSMDSFVLSAGVYF